MVDLQEGAAIATIAAAVIGYFGLKLSRKADKRAQEETQKADEQQKVDTSNVLNMTLDFSQGTGITLLADCWIYNHGKEPITVTKVIIDGTIRSYNQNSTAKIGNYESIKKPTSIAAHDELKLALSFDACKNVKMVKDMEVFICYIDANNNKVKAEVEPKVDRVKLL